jgi:hypothetical protein
VTSSADILDIVASRLHRKGVLALILLLPFVLFACHREEQAVAGVARNAENAERQAQAVATERDQERTQLAQIPLPVKSRYIDVHEPAQWTNPFLAVGPDTITLRIEMADANLSPATEGTFLRPAAARRQELQLRTSDLAKAIAAIPAGDWPYGRVIAVAESPEAPHQDRVEVRRNEEAAIRQLNDLGVVVEEWPSR